jgi:hypothetical protein
MSELKHGFSLREKRFVPEIDAEVYIYQHERTGARLMHIATNDDNKVFDIGFRTPPSDSTGVAHILEHSVLCGSEKYPTKEPFVELLKGSLYTFLNAMTSSDHTTYPVASMNDSDFEILVSVYLDAVFFPNMKTIDEIFYQEGWHYELENRDSELNIKGVVYNEMKGAYSDPNRIIYTQVNRYLFPDTIYRHCSGGDPDVISELTLEQFRDFHKKFYHPSNSYIYLYGKMNIDKMLEIVNENALKRFTKLDLDSSIKPQPLFDKPVEAKCSYPISNEDDGENKVWLSINYLLDLKDDPALEFSWTVISHLLMSTPAAPLKNAILSAGIAKDVLGGYSKSGLHPTFRITLKDTSLENVDKFKSIFFGVLRELCQNGIDKQLIEASININEFELREADMGSYPKGLVYIHYSMGDWMHDLNPIESMCYEDVLRETRKALTTNLYETIIDKHIIQNPHYVFMTMIPEKGLLEKAHAELTEKLAQIKAKMSVAELDAIIERKQRILHRQSAPDSPESLEKIPSLKISDVNPTAEDFTLTEHVNGNITYLDHDVFTNGIAYLKLYFETNNLPQELLPYAQILSYVLGKVDTKNHKFAQLSNLINIHTGGFEFEFDNVANYRDADCYRVFFSINSKALTSKVPQMVEYLTEITQNTVFDDTNRLLEIINELKSRQEMMFMQRADIFGARRLSAYISEAGKFSETISGIEFYFFLRDLLANFETNKANIVEKLTQTYQQIFSVNHLFISITSPSTDITTIKRQLNSWTKNLKPNTQKPVGYKFAFETKNEAFIIPGKVQYVAKGASYKNLGFKYAGDIEVMEIIAQLDYLWNQIRVKGGAYGAMFNITPGGNLYTNSFRDPNLAESLAVYDSMADYLKNINISDREFLKYIIGAVRQFDSPKMPSMKSFYSDYYYFCGKTQTEIQRQRDELLSANINSVKAYFSLIEKVMQQNIYCVFGSEVKVRENEKLFEKVINVFS